MPLFLECGGKRSTTPLFLVCYTRPNPRRRPPKASGVAAAVQEGRSRRSGRAEWECPGRVAQMQNCRKRGKFSRVIVQEFERQGAFENCCGRGRPRSGIWAIRPPDVLVQAATSLRSWTSLMKASSMLGSGLSAVAAFCFRSSGVPAAMIRPRKTSASRSQYSASSMK